MKVKVIKARNSKLIGLTYDLGPPIYVLSPQKTIYQDIAIGYSMHRAQVFIDGNRIDLELTPVDGSKRHFSMDVEILESSYPEIAADYWESIRKGLIRAAYQMGIEKNPKDISLLHTIKKMEVKILNFLYR